MGCSSPNQKFKASDNKEGPYKGLCGRLIKPPDNAVIEQYLEIMRGEGWTDDRFPTTQIWIDVSDEPCIGTPDQCTDRWKLVGVIGLVFAALTGLCIFATMVLDCQTDRQIRRAKQYAQIKAMLPPPRAEITRVQPQGLGSSQQTGTMSPNDGSLPNPQGTADRKGMAIQGSTLGSSSGGRKGHSMV